MTGQRLEEPARTSEKQDARGTANNAKAVDRPKHECLAGRDQDNQTPTLEDGGNEHAHDLTGPCDQAVSKPVSEQDRLVLHRQAQAITFENELDALVKLRAQCSTMQEFRFICVFLHSRLVNVMQQLHLRDEDQRKGALQDYYQTLHQFCSVLAAFGGRDLFIRLVAYNAVLEACRNIHRLLDRLLLQHSFESNPCIHDWKPQFRDDKLLYQSFLADLLRDEQVTIQVTQHPVTYTKGLAFLESPAQPRRFQPLQGQFDTMEGIQHNTLISRDDITLDDSPLARGRNSSVHHGTWNGASVAVKTLLSNELKMRRSFSNVVDIWSKLQHPHIVRLFGVCNDDKPFAVCEFASNGSLSEYVGRKENLTEVWARLYEAALGLEYLHNKHCVVHGEVTCNNILVGKDNSTKLADFGSSFVPMTAEWNADYAVDGDTIAWKAPEILQGMSCGSYAADVYSLGMCIIEALTGQNPWGIVSNAVVEQKVLSKKLPDRPENMTDSQWSLVSQMCAWLPSNRIDMAAVVSTLKKFADEELKAKKKAEMEKNNNATAYELACRRRHSERPEWYIDESQVVITAKQFSSGGFGSIHHGTFTGADVVVKRLLEGTTSCKKGMRSFINEAEVWHKLNHPHVIHLYGACDTSESPFFVCESAREYGNLEEYLYSHDKEKKTIWRLFYETSLGLLYLHQQRIVHGDLKCNNILVSDHKTAKLSDFGLSFIRIESKKMSKQNQTGAIPWMAPECLSGTVDNPTYGSDVYSLAMCIIEAFKGSNPWANTPNITIKNLVKEGSMPLRPEGIPDQAWELVKSMCTIDPKTRIPLTKVVEQLQSLAEEEMNQIADEELLCLNMNCNDLNPTGSNYCRSCGHRLPTQQK